MTVLIVDDDPVSRRLIRLTLERHKKPVAEVADAKSALDWLNADASATLIITELDLPGRMTGVAFFSFLQSNARYRHLPVIVCTSETDQEVVTKAIAAGVRHYLVKPVRPAVLMEKVNEILARSAPVLEPKFDACNRLEISEAEYRYLAEDCDARLVDLTAQLEAAREADNVVDMITIAGRFRGPAALMGAERLVGAVDAALAKDLNTQQRAQAFGLLASETQVLRDHLSQIARPGMTAKRGG
jgi:two-component system, chemotaxis family, chemotaxis protein CheY